MKSQKLMVLFVIVSIAGLCNLINAEFISVEISNTTNGSHKENKTVIELKKNITVITGLNLDISFAQRNHTEASNIPKIRKVTPVDTNSSGRKPRTRLNPTEGKKINATTTAATLKVKILTEAGVIAVKEPAKNITDNIKINSNLSNANNNIEVKNQDSNSNPIATIINKQSSSAAATVTAAETITSIATNFTNSNITTVKTLPISTGNSSGSFSANNGTSPSTINTTTTPKPKKPTITYSVPDFPDLEKYNPEMSNLLELSALNKLPLTDGPYAQPSKEFNSNFHRSRDFILPIVSMIFIIPLIIGILITSYRRFRDCWSTRHYRRMDFLVDGMYND